MNQKRKNQWKIGSKKNPVLDTCSKNEQGGELKAQKQVRRRGGPKRKKNRLTLPPRKLSDPWNNEGKRTRKGTCDIRRVGRQSGKETKRSVSGKKRERHIVPGPTGMGRHESRPAGKERSLSVRPARKNGESGKEKNRGGGGLRQSGAVWR